MKENWLSGEGDKFEIYLSNKILSRVRSPYFLKNIYVIYHKTMKIRNLLSFNLG